MCFDHFPLFVIPFREVSCAVCCGGGFDRSQHVLIGVYVYMPFSRLLFLQAKKTLSYLC